MKAADVIDALALPAGTRVDRRVPKKTLSEHGAANATARRRIREGLDALHWVAALKPSNCGVPTFVDETREYVEVAVLEASVRAGAKPSQLQPLIHRAVPYPVVLVMEQAGSVSVSLAHKRWSQAEKGQTIVDGEAFAVTLPAETADDDVRTFLAALAFDKQRRETLFSLYQGWMDALIAMRAAPRCEGFRIPTNREHASARRDALQECERLEAEIAKLRAAASREQQMPRRVELNLQLQRLTEQNAAARAKL